jgi:hypothetical protein
MSIPLDNLYNWVEGLLPSPAVLYLFLPHGSKNISDLTWARYYVADQTKLYLMPAVICHDQEPLYFDDYQNISYQCNNWADDKSTSYNKDIASALQKKNAILKDLYKNLSYVPRSHDHYIFDKIIILHSEKNSIDVAKFAADQFIPVYYWSHAIIALDWYRFAKYDTRLQSSEIKNKFLIYCRDWTGHREYRLKFIELLQDQDLVQHSAISFMHTSNNTHYSEHVFANKDFEPLHPETLVKIDNNYYSSNSSGGYEPADFNHSAVSVVLETEFDNQKIHLTEKILRPIACSHPFVLAAGPGSLEYLRSYGFETFSPWIDESYDTETDSLTRLNKIIKAMKKISELPADEFDNFCVETKRIAQRNQEHFYSNRFFNQVQEELKNNMSLAFDEVIKTRGTEFLKVQRRLKAEQELQILFQHPGVIDRSKEMARVIRRYRQSSTF